jgi:hypothetical protein
MTIGLAGKVFAQSQYSAFFKKQYTSTTEMANDLAKGKLALVPNIDTLRFINMQLDNWNTQLSAQGVKKDDASIFQIESNFISMEKARPYFYSILTKHCEGVILAWKEGDFLISRINKTTGEVTEFLRKSYDKEIVAALKTKTFSEVSDADGDAGKPNVYGFSLICGNKLTPKKVEQAPQSVVFVPQKQAAPSILAPSYEVVYTPIYDNTPTGSGTGNTYTITNTVNNPAPVVVKDKRNNEMLLMVGMTVVGQLLNTGVQMWSMNQQYKMSQRQFSNYQTVQYYPLPTFTSPLSTPIQGNTGGVQYTPIEGNTGGVVGYTPIQGYNSGVVGYSPIQGYGGQ